MFDVNGLRLTLGPLWRPARRRALLDYHNQMCGRERMHITAPAACPPFDTVAEGGETNQDDLVVLWWFHDQVVVHECRFEIVFLFLRRPKTDPVQTTRQR